jgi:hypothetical protein
LLLQGAGNPTSRIVYGGGAIYTENDFTLAGTRIFSNHATLQGQGGGIESAATKSACCGPLSITNNTAVSYSKRTYLGRLCSYVMREQAPRHI